MLSYSPDARQVCLPTQQADNYKGKNSSIKTFILSNLWSDVAINTTHTLYLTSAQKTKMFFKINSHKLKVKKLIKSTINEVIYLSLSHTHTKLNTSVSTRISSKIILHLNFSALIERSLWLEVSSLFLNWNFQFFFMSCCKKKMMAFEQAVIASVTKQPLVMYVEVSRFICSIIAYLHNKGTSSIALTRVNTWNIS